MPIFRLFMDGVPVRYTNDLPTKRQTRFQYALTFDQKDSSGTTNPIARFQVIDGRIQETETKLYLKHMWWDSFYAVLVSDSYSNTDCCWEILPTSSPNNTYYIRYVVTALGWTHYLGSGDRFEPVGGSCPPRGRVRLARVVNGVPVPSQGWCMKREWTIEAEDETQKEQIVQSLLPIHSCNKAEDCVQYGKHGQICDNGVCVYPEPSSMSVSPQSPPSEHNDSSPRSTRRTDDEGNGSGLLLWVIGGGGIFLFLVLALVLYAFKNRQSSS